MSKFKIGDSISPEKNLRMSSPKKEIAFTMNKSYNVLYIHSDGTPVLIDEEDSEHIVGENWMRYFHKSSNEERCLTEILYGIEDKGWFNSKLENHITLENDILVIKRKTATSIYKNISRPDKLRNLDMYFIETINPILRKYDICIIDFKSGDYVPYRYLRGIITKNKWKRVLSSGKLV